jgi:carboxylesterase
VLLVHGFTATPYTLRPWGEHLAAAGLTVRCPLLPGHGTDWREMSASTWQDWYGAVEEHFDDLRARCSQVFVMGLSMGGTLTLRLAEERGAQLAGVVTVNPSLGTDRRAVRLTPLLARAIPSIPSRGDGDIKAPGVQSVGYDRIPLRAVVSLLGLWKATIPDLHRVVCPVLTFRSVVDHVVEPSSGRRLVAGVTSAPVTERLLEDSYHVATLDNDRETIFAESVEFVRTHAIADDQRAGSVPADSGA